MAPTRRNGVPLMRTGPDSGDRRAGKRAHSAPGRDATIHNQKSCLVPVLTVQCKDKLTISAADKHALMKTNRA